LSGGKNEAAGAVRQPGAADRVGNTLLVAVISDTHGILYPEVKAALVGVDHIIHAGDIGSLSVLEELRKLAPVTAVRGNCDLDGWSESLPGVTTVDLAGVRILVGHRRDSMPGGGIGARMDDAATPQQVRPVEPTASAERLLLISGHSHLASLEERDGVIFLNPGSAGPRRFGRPRTIARVELRDGEAEAQIVIVQS
jgi:putative phosphoesterase